ncbi:MAG: AAA family ATPase, partial [Anaerolineales bacterium]|nr:AAA family ATPase [Anaerolineales bacterium]
MLEIHMFGSPDILLDQKPVKISRRKSRAVLYYLAGQSQPVNREKILNIFWSDQPRAAGLQVLRTTLHGLRGTLGEAIQVLDDRIGLSSDVWVDARRLEEVLSTDFDPHRWSGILDVYRGDFLDEVFLPDSSMFEDWLVVERERYRRLAVRGLTTLSVWHEGQGDYSQALSCLDRALVFNPLQEDLQRESMRIHYLAGDRPGAIRRYDDLRRLLDEEMGVPPMVETRKLYDAILTDRLTDSGVVDRFRMPTRPESRQISQPPGELNREFRLPFAGRAEEIQKLAQGLSACRLTLVEGEPGIGKTRLVEEYLARSKAIALTGRAHELEQNLPYQPIITTLRSLFQRSEWSTMRVNLARDLSLIWRTEIGRLIPDQPDLFPVAPGTAVDETRLWESIYQFLAAISRRHELMIFLDDIQWADSSSIGLLGYLVRRNYPGSVGFIATVRTFNAQGAFHALVQALTRERKIERILLTRLSSQDIQTIAARLSPARSSVLAERLAEASEGNPYIVSELVRQAQESQVDQPGWENNLLQKSVVPGSIYTFIQSRLTRLSEPARRVLDVGVAFGRTFDFHVVSQAAGLSEGATLDGLDELIKAGLVQALPNFQFSFDHHLTLDVAYQEVGETRHRLLHHRVALALEKIHHDRLDEFSSLLAWHFNEGGDPERASPYAFLAGKRAAGLAGWDEAITFFEQALVGANRSQRPAILATLGETQAQAGHFVQASETYRELIRLAQDNKEVLGLNALRLSLARTLLPQARFAEAIAQARLVIESSDPDARIKAELVWGTALSIEGAYLGNAREHLLAANELLGQQMHPDRSSQALVLFELGSLTAQQGNLAQAIHYYRQSLDVANQSDEDRFLEVRILATNNLAYHLLLLGDPSARETIQSGLKLARE